VNKKSNKLNRSDIEKYIQNQLPHISNNQIKLSIDLIINQIVEAVAMDEKVEIRGFGTFSKKFNANSALSKSRATINFLFIKSLSAFLRV
jgi:nucleoid DNA-binding protein